MDVCYSKFNGLVGCTLYFMVVKNKKGKFKSEWDVLQSVKKKKKTVKR